MKKILALLLALAMALAMCACGHEHVWTEATCTEPKTCTECGKTEGEPLGHTWIDATCTEPKICSVCGETEGEPAGHTMGAWETVKEATLSDNGQEVRYCTVCGELADSRVTDKKTIEYKGGAFNFTKEEFMDFYRPAFTSTLSRYSLGKNPSSKLDPAGGYAYAIMKGGVAINCISFRENGSKNVDAIFVWGNEDTAYFAAFTFETMCGDDCGNDAFNALESDGFYTNKGLKITYENIGGGYTIYTIKGA